MVAVLEPEQSAVPPQMVLQVVAALPIGRERGEPLDAFAAPALHLQHMGDGVRGPEIAGVELDGAAPGWLGGEIVPGLLLGEAAAGEDRCVACDVLRPIRHHPLDGADHVLRAAEPEIDEMGETEGDYVVRMDAQNRLPQGDRTIELAFGPSGQRGDVAALARGGFGGERLRGARRLDRDRNDRLLESEHGEIALHAMSKREVRIDFQDGGETGGRIGSKGEVAGDEMVEGSGSFGAGGRDGEAAGIEMHGVVLADIAHLRDPFAHCRAMIRRQTDFPTHDGRGWAAQPLSSVIERGVHKGSRSKAVVPGGSWTQRWRLQS